MGDLARSMTFFVRLALFSLAAEVSPSADSDEIDFLLTNEQN
jgi:hypothetical protein